jgi:hypothetical protein
VTTFIGVDLAWQGNKNHGQRRAMITLASGEEIVVSRNVSCTMSVWIRGTGPYDSPAVCMNESALANAVQRPEIHRQLLGAFRGAYALGVTQAPGNEADAAFLLRVEGPVPAQIPKSIAVDGEDVPVIVEGNFKAPRRL